MALRQMISDNTPLSYPNTLQNKEKRGTLRAPPYFHLSKTTLTGGILVLLWHQNFAFTDMISR